MGEGKRFLKAAALGAALGAGGGAAYHESNNKAAPLEEAAQKEVADPNTPEGKLIQWGSFAKEKHTIDSLREALDVSTNDEAEQLLGVLGRIVDPNLLTEANRVLKQDQQKPYLDAEGMPVDMSSVPQATAVENDGYSKTQKTADTVQPPTPPGAGHAADTPVGISAIEKPISQGEVKLAFHKWSQLTDKEGNPNPRTPESLREVLGVSSDQEGLDLLKTFNDVPRDDIKNAERVLGKIEPTPPSTS